MSILTSTDLTWPVILFRITIAFILSAIIGFERERSRQVAGLRTHILICVGATILMILSIYLPLTYSFGNGAGDPGRIAAQVVSGIGFLGAGAILRFGLNVKGLTTAANIWVIAAIGLVVGAGMYLTAIFGVVIILITLVGINKIEKKLFSKQYTKIIEIKGKETLSYNEIKKIVSKFGRIANAELIREEDSTELRFTIHLKNGSTDSLLKELKDKNISKISIHEGN